VRCVRADTEFWCRFFEGVEFREKLGLAELLLRKAALLLVVGVDEVLHFGSPIRSPFYRAYARHFP
jgi:hypothetical protein